MSVWKRGATLHKSLRFLMRPGYFSRLAERHPFGRWLPLLLVALQIVAPLWHVCEMGGQCDDCKPQNGVQICRIEPKDQAAAPHCARCKPEKAAKTTSQGSISYVDGRAGHFKGTCLARELMGMGRVTVAPLVLHFQTVCVRLVRPKNTRRRLFFAFNLPLSRGPPAPFVA